MRNIVEVEDIVSNVVPLVTSQMDLGGTVSELVSVAPAPAEIEPRGLRDKPIENLIHVPVAVPSRADAVRRMIEPALPLLVAMWLISVVVLSLKLLIGGRIDAEDDFPLPRL